MAISPKHLIWIDLEMTGLDTLNDAIIEIATVITDENLEVIAEGPVIAIKQTTEKMHAMDDWNRTHHGNSGLTARVLASEYATGDAEQITLQFLRQWVPAGSSPMCGNSICQDRRFLARCMPELEAWFHYRNLDVSTLKILAERWSPTLFGKMEKTSKHRALDDILESIDELRYYRKHLLKTEVNF